MACICNPSTWQAEAECISVRPNVDCIVRPFVKESRSEWESSVEERLLCKGKTLSLVPSTENFKPKMYILNF